MKNLGRVGLAAVLCALLAPVTPGLASPAQAQEVVDGPRVNWKVALWGKSRPFTTNAEVMKKHVETRTGGKFSITLGYEVFGSAKEFPDLVKIGSVQAAMVTPTYYPERLPVYSVMDLPFLPVGEADAYVRAQEALARHPAAVAEIANQGSRYFVAVVVEPYLFMGRGRPPKSLADFKGMRVRAIGGQGAAMLRLGAVPTSMDASEVYTSLERGVIEAAAFPGTSSHASYRIYELAKWFTDNIDIGVGASPIIINNEAWAALPPQYQKILDEVPPLAYEEYKRVYKAADEKNIPLFKKRGIDFIHYSDEELAEFRKVGGQPIWEEWVAKRSAQGLPAREILDLVLKAAEGDGKSR
jgi:TRAP-type C4-dicarboxylate transport system substrate-binding protein